MENALILQQPVALHAYFLKEGIIQERDRILIIDGGFRTVEMTDMKQNVILNHYEAELGCSKPLKNIKNIVQNHETSQVHTLIQKSWMHTSKTSCVYYKNNLS